MLSKDKGVTEFFRDAFLFDEIYFRKCRATYKLYLKRAFHKGVAKRLVGCLFYCIGTPAQGNACEKGTPAQGCACAKVRLKQKGNCYD